MDEYKYHFCICNRYINDKELLNNTINKFDRVLAEDKSLFELSKGEMELIYSVLRNYHIDIFGSDFQIKEKAND